jgi:hypothetical protein
MTIVLDSIAYSIYYSVALIYYVAAPFAAKAQEHADAATDDLPIGRTLSSRHDIPSWPVSLPRQVPAYHSGL